MKLTTQCSERKMREKGLFTTPSLTSRLSLTSRYHVKLKTDPIVNAHDVVDSQAVGWDSWVWSALNLIFWEDPIFDSAAWLLVLILISIFTLILEIQIHEKNAWQKKNHFWRPIFIKLHIYKEESRERKTPNGTHESLPKISNLDSLGVNRK